MTNQIQNHGRITAFKLCGKGASLESTFDNPGQRFATFAEVKMCGILEIEVFTTMNCSFCRDAVLTPRIDWIEVEHRGHKDQVNQCYSVCDSCGTEQSTEEDLMENKRIVVAFKRAIDEKLYDSSTDFRGKA